MLNIFRSTGGYPAGGYPARTIGTAHPGSDSASGWQWNLRIQQQSPQEAAQAESVADGPAIRSSKMQKLEAVLMVADGPLSLRKLAQFATLADNTEVKQLIDDLNAAYEYDGSAFRVERVATGHQLLTQRRFSTWLDRLHQRQAALKLSPAAMETLTIVAYRQPITRADVEAVRGVQASEMLKQLLERKLIRVAGEDDSLGRPYLYGTTRQFLEVFGMHSLDDMPMANTLRQSAKEKSAERTGILTPPDGPQLAEGLGEDDEDYDEEDDEDYDEDDYDEEDVA